ncbi:hypothetical protein BAUCODRAFT_506302 [Baudoinia panamericana UAMH 10762]|uniref:Uncharacterized protein n=1 Tax=Baudoinia panamericana (strain UAMH 10762) TaxID=717646 RepID=M2NAG8_BAUPA|nr:uncharacterized protein BAUCODRAFT_506302 [Baudoinia panamericana UAMH 10762]EMC95845.1 hypothetical protein BAUCODRAFT_506302 [Baudoinia panamericana UAMH 10762]
MEKPVSTARRFPSNARKAERSQHTQNPTGRDGPRRGPGSPTNKPNKSARTVAEIALLSSVSPIISSSFGVPGSCRTSQSGVPHAHNIMSFTFREGAMCWRLTLFGKSFMNA